MIKWSVKVAWFISMAVVAQMSLMPAAEMPQLFPGADKIAHCLAYGWLAILPFFGFEKMRAASAGALLMIPYGIILEFAQQHVPGRDFSFADMAAGGVGVILGMVAARYLKEIPWFNKV